jgi:hypothetical protein
MDNKKKFTLNTWVKPFANWGVNQTDSTLIVSLLGASGSVSGPIEFKPFNFLFFSSIDQTMSWTDDSHLGEWNSMLVLADIDPRTNSNISYIYRCQGPGDPTAHTNVHLVYDSDNATASERVRIFLNGNRMQGYYLNGTIAQGRVPNLGDQFAGSPTIGSTSLPANWITPASRAVNGGAIISNYAFVDNAALPPTAFGGFHPITKQWRPVPQDVIKGVVDSGGKKSFFLTFNDRSSTTNIIKDYSKNALSLSNSNLTLTPGTSQYCGVKDTPTNNFPVAVPNKMGALERNIWVPTYSGIVATTKPRPGYNFSNSTLYGAVQDIGQGISGVRIYFEAKLVAKITIASHLYTPSIGVRCSSALEDRYIMYHSNGTLDVLLPNNSSESSTAVAGGAYSEGDVVSVVCDTKTGDIRFYKNNVVMVSMNRQAGNAFSAKVAVSGAYYGNAPSGTRTFSEWILNLGQTPFTYSMPVGCVTYSSKNLPTPNIKDPSQYVCTPVYSGSGAAGKIIDVASFSPGVLLLKTLNVTGAWKAYDVTRATATLPAAYLDLVLNTNANSAQVTANSNERVSPTGTGFSLSGTGGTLNTSGNNFLATLFKAGTEITPGSALTNSSGWASVGKAQGISVVRYSGASSSSPQMISHGLGPVKSLFVLVKNLTEAADWRIGHSSLTTNLDMVNLSFTNAAAFTATNSSASTGNAVVPQGGTSLFYTWRYATNNALEVGKEGDEYVAFCFTEVPGFSKLGSFTMSADPFSFVNNECGFTPAVIIIKSVNVPGDWFIWTDEMNTVAPFYPNQQWYSRLNTTGAKETQTYSLSFDPLVINSTGFTAVAYMTPRLGILSPGTVYIYAAFAKFPYKYSNGYAPSEAMVALPPVSNLNLLITDKGASTWVIPPYNKMVVDVYGRGGSCISGDYCGHGGAGFLRKTFLAGTSGAPAPGQVMSIYLPTDADMNTKNTTCSVGTWNGYVTAPTSSFVPTISYGNYFVLRGGGMGVNGDINYKGGAPARSQWTENGWVSDYSGEHFVATVYTVSGGQHGGGSAGPNGNGGDGTWDNPNQTSPGSSNGHAGTGNGGRAGGGGAIGYDGKDYGGGGGRDGNYSGSTTPRRPGLGGAACVEITIT